MQKLYAFLLIIFCFFATDSISQNCYIQLDDISGLDPSKHQEELESFACSIVDSLPEIYRDSFKVFGFGFYRHHKSMDSDYSEVLDLVRQQIDEEVPYYLLFAKETTDEQIYKQFIIDLKLPIIEGSSCFTLTKNESIKTLIEQEVSQVHEENKLNPYRYYEAEEAGMNLLKRFVQQMTCCQERLNLSSINARNNQCNYCFYTPEQQINLLKEKGMVEIVADDLIIEIANDATYDNADFETQHTIKISRTYGDRIVNWNLTDELNQFLSSVPSAKARVLYFDDISCPNFEDYIDGKYPSHSRAPGLGTDSPFFEEIIILNIAGQQRVFFKLEGTDQSESSILWSLEHLAAMKRGGLTFLSICLEVEECFGGFNNWLETWQLSEMFSNNWEFVKAAWEAETGVVGAYGWSYPIAVEIGEYLVPSRDPVALNNGSARSSESMGGIEQISIENHISTIAGGDETIVKTIYKLNFDDTKTSAVTAFKDCKAFKELPLESFDIGFNKSTVKEVIPKTYFTPTGELYAIPGRATPYFFFCKEEFPDGTLRGFITDDKEKYGAWFLIEGRNHPIEEAPARKFAGYAKRKDAQNPRSLDNATFLPSATVHSNSVYIGKIASTYEDNDVVQICKVGTNAPAYDNRKRKKDELTIISTPNYFEVTPEQCEDIKEHPTCKDECRDKYAEHPYLKDPCGFGCDPIQEIIKNENPCLIATLEHHNFDYQPQSEFMNELGNIVFYMVGGAMTIPLISTALPTILEEIVKQGATRFAGGVLIDAVLQSAIHYYFPKDGIAITWEVARDSIDWKQASASGVENMIDLNSAVGNAMVSGAFSCGVDGWLENGKLRDDFNWTKCGIGALSAVMIQGVFSGSGALYRHLKEMPAEQFMDGLIKLIGDLDPNVHLNGASINIKQLHWKIWKIFHSATPSPSEVKGMFKIDDDVVAQQVSEAIAANPAFVASMMENGLFVRLLNKQLDFTRAERASLLNDFLNGTNGQNLLSAIGNNDQLVNAWSIFTRANRNTLKFDTDLLEKLSTLLKNNTLGWNAENFTELFTKHGNWGTRGAGDVYTDIVDGVPHTFVKGQTLSADEMIQALQLLSNNASRVNGLDLMLSDLCCKSLGFYIGAEKVLRVLTKENLGLQKIITGVTTGATLTLEKSLTNPTRIVDIYVEKIVNGISKQILREIKSVKSLPSNFVEQFSKDLQHIQNLDDLKWIFDSKYGGNLKDDVIAALEGSKALLENISASKANTLLDRIDLTDDNKQEIANELIKFFKNQSNFDKIFTKL